MKIKKLLAGVLAASLAATSLAVVNVSAADKTATYSFIHKMNDVTFTYSKQISARAGANLNQFLAVEETDTVGGITGKKEFIFGLNPGGVWVNNYDAPSTTALMNGLANPKYDGLGSIEVTGTDAKGNSQTVKTDFKLNSDGRLMFYGVVDTDTDHLLGKNELDLGRIVDIKTIKITQNFKKTGVPFTAPNDYNVGYYGFGANYVAGNTCSDEGFAKFLAQEVASDNDETYWPFKNNEYQTGGAEIKFDTIYGLENNSADFTDEGPGGAIDLPSNSNITFLQWVNDTIGYAKGAKIKFTFAPGSSDSNNNLTIFGQAGVTGQRPWFTEGGSSSSAQANDMVLAVNSHSSNLLRQEVLMEKEGDNYTATFDWDTVMNASPTTALGHVTSISFALNNGHLGNGSTKIPGDHIDEIKMKNKNAAKLIQIDITVPEGQVTPSDKWDDTVVTVKDENSGVGAELTNKALTGNGGSIIKATGTLTTNKLTYEVKLLDKDGNAVQPAGDVILTLPIPKDMQGRTINKVTHYKHDGTSEQLDVINKDTYLTDKFVKVKTSSFSGFEIEFEDTTATEAPATEAPATEAPATEAPATEAPATEAPADTTAAAGDVNNGGNDKNIPTGFAIALVPAAIAAAGVVVAKKRK